MYKILFISSWKSAGALATPFLEMNDLELVFLETYPSFSSNNPKIHPKCNHKRRRKHIGFYDVQKSQNLQHKTKHPFK